MRGACRQAPSDSARTTSNRIENTLDRLGHALHVGHSIDSREQPARFVNRNDRFGLRAILGHARAHGFLVIVRTALELMVPAHVTGIDNLGLLELVVIAGATIAARKPPDDPLDDVWLA